MIIDQFKMIQSGGDGGDSCHRMYTSFIRLTLQSLLGLIKTVPEPFDKIAGPTQAQLLLEPNRNGLYIRNPDPTKWYSDPRNFSRDQMTPVICFYALMSDFADPEFSKQAQQDQWRLLKACMGRYMFSQNIYPNWVDPRVEVVKKKIPDFIDPTMWGIFARTWINSPWVILAVPFVVLGDMFMVLSAIFKVWAPINKDGTLQFRMSGPDDVDDDNMNSCLMVSQYVFPTIFSNLARKIYKTFRRKNNGNDQMGETDPVMGAIAWYNRNDNPEMTELARPLVKRY